MSSPSEAQCEYAAAAPYAVAPRERSPARVSVLFYMGPAFLVSVGYIDPGNWATSLEAGSRFGYRLLWVVLLSNLIALVIQNLAARLGLVTGESYAANCRRHFGRPLWLSIWLATEAALVATNVAEFLGRDARVSARFRRQRASRRDSERAGDLRLARALPLRRPRRRGGDNRLRGAGRMLLRIRIGAAIRLDRIAIGRRTVTPWLD